MLDASFIEIGQIRKGAPKSDKGYMGKDLPHFRVVFNEGEEETAALFAQEFPENPTELEIMFPFDEPHRVWEYGLEAYTGRGIRVMLVDADTNLIRYWIDPRTGEAIVRNSLGKNGEAVYWDRETPAYSYPGKNGELKHVMPTLRCRLRVMIPKLKRIVYFQVVSGSWYDKANITRQLTAYYQLAGSLKGIPFILRRRQQEVPCSRPDGSKVRDKKSLISIEASEEWSARMFDALKSGAMPDAEKPQSFGLSGEMPTIPEPEPHHDDDDYPSDDGGEWYGEPPREPKQEIAEPESPATKSATRPLEPTVLKEFLHRKAGDDQTPATERQPSLVARKFQEAFAPAEDAQKQYHMALSWLLGVDSATKLTKMQAKALLDWLLDPSGPDDTGDTPLHPSAPVEAIRVYQQAMKDAGQQELPL